VNSYVEAVIESTKPLSKADSKQKGRIWGHVLKLGLPYTFIDIGWWYEVTLPPVPSGQLDYCVPLALRPTWGLGLDGNVPSAITYTRDIGKWVAKIIVDPRTLNRMVFTYNEVLTRNQVYDILEHHSKEKLDRHYVSFTSSLYSYLFGLQKLTVFLGRSRKKKPVQTYRRSLILLTRIREI
jgi:NmrA-like family